MAIRRLDDTHPLEEDAVARRRVTGGSWVSDAGGVGTPTAPLGWSGRITGPTGRSRCRRSTGVLPRLSGTWRRANELRCCSRTAGLSNGRCGPLRGPVSIYDPFKSHRVRTNRSWIRDSGPIFVVRGGRNRIEVALTDWHFNGWARYRAWKDDDAVPSRLARCLGMRRFAVYCDEPSCRRRVVLEGGSIDVNGQGLLLTTEECLLSPVQVRNPGMSKAELEAVFARNLGVRRVLWLRGGIAGDDTHGHVDDVARFVSARTVAAAMESDRTDENFEVLRENFERLRSMRDLSGRPLTILRLPMPRALYFEGQRLPASYLNFYIGNRRVLVPTFNDRNDRLALDRLRRAFPGREVVGIHAAELVLGLGAVHCLTQQEPGAPDDLN